MNKKGEIPYFAVMLIASTIALLVLLFIFKGPASAAGRLISSRALQELDDACKLETQNEVDKGLKLGENKDLDKDGRLDRCDICVSCTGENSNNDIDSDGDKMPDYCDQDLQDRTVVACKNSMKETNDGRCVDKNCPYK